MKLSLALSIANLKCFMGKHTPGNFVVETHQGLLFQEPGKEARHVHVRTGTVTCENCGKLLHLQPPKIEFM